VAVSVPSRWQTPARSDADHLPSYQSYASLVGHATVTYAADRRSATVAVTLVAKQPADYTYSFAGRQQNSNTAGVACGRARMR
jgi:hypothetical protein